MSKKRVNKTKEDLLKNQKNIEKQASYEEKVAESKRKIIERIESDDAFFIFWGNREVSWVGLPDKSRWIGFVQDLIFQDYESKVFCTLYRNIFGAMTGDPVGASTPPVGLTAQEEESQEEESQEEESQEEPNVVSLSIVEPDVADSDEYKTYLQLVSKYGSVVDS